MFKNLSRNPTNTLSLVGFFILYHFLSHKNITLENATFVRWKYWITIWAWELSWDELRLAISCSYSKYKSQTCYGFSSHGTMKGFFLLYDTSQKKKYFSKFVTFSLIFMTHFHRDPTFSKQIKLFIFALSYQVSTLERRQSAFEWHSVCDKEFNLKCCL